MGLVLNVRPEIDPCVRHIISQKSFPFSVFLDEQVVSYWRMSDLESRGYYLCIESKGAFVFVYAKSWFSHDAAEIISITRIAVQHLYFALVAMETNPLIISSACHIQIIRTRNDIYCIRYMHVVKLQNNLIE